MTKRPFGHGPLQWMGNFKAVQADYEYYLSLENVGRLYCLTDRQVYVLMVQLEYVGWLTRWYNTDDITQTTVGYIQSELMERLMSCVDIQVLIDQASLNLVNDTTDQQIQSQALRDILDERYDGTPTSINPNAPTTNFGASGDRYDALCAGLMAFVYQFARSQADSVRAGQIGGLAAVALVAALLIPGLNFFFLVGASIAVLAGLGTIGVTTETAIAALTDKTALDAVVCYMRDQLSGLAVTETNWNACLDTYPFAVGSHEAIVADFIKACLPANYLTILNILGQAYTGVINGDPVPECPCGPSACPPEGDFTTGQHGWTSATGSNDYTRYHPGQGFGRGDTFPNRIGIRANLDVSGASRTIQIRWSAPMTGTLDLSTYVYSGRKAQEIIGIASDTWQIEFEGFADGVLIDTYPSFEGVDWPADLRLVCVDLID